MKAALLFQVDAFADRPFRGNPAAVCLLPKPASVSWMRNVAREMNLSETAFLHPEKNGYRLRWFTPTVEVGLCGHATLASAHVLWQEGRLKPAQEALFFTRSGPLKARRRSGWIDLDFPTVPAAPCPPPKALLEGLKTKFLYVGSNSQDYLVEIASESQLRALVPDLRALARLEKPKGVCVTARSKRPGIDFVSRLFAPGAGIDEDPVTGSSHCMLAPYWAPKLGKERMTGYQASARGGTVKVWLRGDRTVLSGRAVTVLKGRLTP